MIGDKMTEVFEFLFRNDEDSVIIFQTGKGIVKMNESARKFFSGQTKENFGMNMDKSSHDTWQHFLREAENSSLARCHIRLSDKSNEIYEVEGCYNQSISKYIIRFRQVDNYSFSSVGIIENLMKYKSVFECAPYGIIFSDVDGIILEVNQRMESLIGISPEELVGESCYRLFELFSDSSDCAQRFQERLELESSSEATVIQKDLNGEEKYLHIESKYSEIIDMFVTVIRDETEKLKLEKQMEHTLTLSNLGQLAASIAHEIRNPLTSLKGFTQLLSDQVTIEGNRYLEIINSELNRMEDILNEFLVLSKPAERSVHYISISSIITEVVEFMHPQALYQHIEIEFSSKNIYSDCILGDANELKKVFMNILKNAMEVMPNGGKITIIQTLDKNKHIRVSVQDQGVGMTPEQLNKIFLPFYTSKQHGTGLGLAHASKTIENHGGHIEVVSEVNDGTTFHLFFPLHTGSMKESNINDQTYAKSNW